MSAKIVADTHIHSLISHDAESELSMICRSAASKGISVICLTDHVDVERHQNPEFWNDVDFSVDSVKAIRDVADEAGVSVMAGTELGQMLYYPEIGKKVIERHEYDHIIISQHTLFDESDFYYIAPERIIKEGDAIIQRYLADLLDTFNLVNGDVLAHLTYPARYFFREGYPLDMDIYTDKIREIYALLIEKEIALECNTSGLFQPIGTTLPDEKLLKLYYEMGGRLITLGSDAHRDVDVGKGIPQATQLLKNIGFKEAFYYKKRKPQPYEL